MASNTAYCTNVHMRDYIAERCAWWWECVITDRHVVFNDRITSWALTAYSRMSRVIRSSSIGFRLDWSCPRWPRWRFGRSNSRQRPHVVIAISSSSRLRSSARASTSGSRTLTVPQCCVDPTDRYIAYRHPLKYNGHFPRGPVLPSTRMSPFWILLELRLMKVVGGNNWSYKTCKAPVIYHHYQQTNTQLFTGWMLN